MDKLKSKCNINTMQHDSGSESAHLLSSGSHSSIEPMAFQDSEISNLDSASSNNYFKYGSVETCSLDSNAIAILKRPPPVNEDHILVTASSISTSCSLNVIQDRCYDIHNIDLVFSNDSNDKQSQLNDITKFLSVSCSSQQEAINSKPKQNSLVTVKYSFTDSTFGTPEYSIFDNTSHLPEVLCLKKVINNDTNYVTHDYTYSALGPVWDLYKTVPIFLGLLIFPFLNWNSPTFFTKFNALGTLSVMYLIMFVLIKSTSWGINMSEIEWENSWILKSSFPALSGMLALSFFIHNIIITIMQNNRDQSKNGRDLSIAYLLVTLTYIIVGVLFYVCFPLNKLCIEDNFLNNFQKWSGLTVGARIVLLFQLLTVYPLLAYMLRVQLLSSLCKTYNMGCVIIINIILISICILFAIFVPYIGTIIRYTGALSGFIYVFTLPSLLYLVILKEQQKLSIFSVLLHISIPIFGLLNLVAQFFITEI
ncbi:neutral amino acid transporter 9 isoform X2 [Megachile rotundata]|uniref:neutral amino acid transporter 9 isoform X2 n=1 Tax=Megachile rotundata TaxID=143995 RepID=UPI003FD68312